MTQDSQAEFIHEEQHLEQVVGSIDATIQYIENRGPVIEGDTKAANIVQDLRNHSVDELRSIRHRPYFGRIDYSSEPRGPSNTIYIGDLNVNNRDEPRYSIASRNAPIAQLYYRPTDGFYEYEIPVGRGTREARLERREATVALKRTLNIEDAQLLDLDDVLRLPGVVGAPAITSSRALDERLSNASEARISDAAQTIQPAQYEQIAATLKPVLIVQGAAGSGKSLIALHRIDFILSPFSNIGNLTRPTSERVIMFGPTPAFLAYVSGLLPTLGVHRVRQTTITNWLLAQFSSRVTLRSGDTVFDDLMNNRSRRGEAEIEAHLFKGGLKMKGILDNYVNHLKREIRAQINEEPAFVIRDKLRIELSAGELKNRVKEAFAAYPEPNAARVGFVNGLADQFARTDTRRNVPQGEILMDARRTIDRALTFWPRLDFRIEYKNLLSDPQRILQHSKKGDIDFPIASEVSQTAPSMAGRALSVTDLAAALYLDYIINGLRSERFEHIVVDEAQDVSPLEIELLRMHSTNNSFTILGDLRQSILPFKSITSWNQFRSLFDKESVSRLDSRLTYRSTRQITQYANRILMGLPARTARPRPHSRNGERPNLVRSGTAAEMRHRIAQSVQMLRSKSNVRSVAVLTKWRQTAHDISGYLKEARIQDVEELTQGELIATDITISPIVLTKGLEFDAVIVANAQKDNLNETEFDRTLLYTCLHARPSLPRDTLVRHPLSDCSRRIPAGAITHYRPEAALLLLRRRP